MNATQAQIDYINSLRDSILAEMEKPLGSMKSNNLYSGHFFNAQRNAIKAEKRTSGRSSREVKAEFAARQMADVEKWIISVKSQLDFNPADLSKSEASAMIDNLKKPEAILKIEI